MSSEQEMDTETQQLKRRTELLERRMGVAENATSAFELRAADWGRDIDPTILPTHPKKRGPSAARDDPLAGAPEKKNQF